MISFVALVFFIVAAVGLGGRAARTARATAAAAAVGAGEWGRPQKVPVKLIEDKEKTEMREATKHPHLTCIFYSKTHIFEPKIKNDPMVDTHLLVVGFHPKQR